MREQILNYFQNNYQAYYSKHLPDTKKVGGNEFKARCPFPPHEDTNPSFNFNNQTGQYLCRGCGKKGDIFHFYGKLNSLDTKRDFPKILKGISKDFGIPWEEQKGRITKTYDYVNQDGNLLFQVCRVEPGKNGKSKDFSQRRPGPNGDWIWNLKGIEPVLYGLPEVLKAQEILIVEGEKDVDNIMALGFTATTNPMGAKSWKDSYNEPLKGKNIILIPDNDPEGREHMTQVAISLNGTAKSLKWIDLEGLPSKGDVSDWIAKRTDKQDAAERLAIMIENADPYEPPKKASIEDAILSASDFVLLNVPEKREMLFPWLKENSVNLIAGWRGAGKTWFALSLLDAVSNGKPFGPWECKNPVPCLFLDGEMPVGDIIERTNYLQINSDRKNPLHIYSDAYANSLGLPRAHLASETWRTKMKSILIARKIKLFVIDNLASLAGGLDENSKKDWDPINSWLLELRFAGISTIMLHHVNKEGGQRGTSGREDNLDISIMIKIPYGYDPEDGCRFIARFTKARVSTKDLKLVSDTEFKLILDESGDHVWSWGNVKKETKKAILELIHENEKITNQGICETLDLSKGYVSKVISQAKKDDLLTQKGSLTSSGYSFISEGEK